MKFEVTKKMLDDTLASLIGQSIVDIRYATIDYSDDTPYWDFGKIHEVEHGVEFTTETGEIYQISWHNYESDYGVTIAKKGLMSFWLQAVLWQVTEREEWRMIHKQSIKEIKTYWMGWNDKFSLQDVEFEFSNGIKIWFSASRYDSENDRLLGGSDDISIIFDEPGFFKRGSYTDEKNVEIEVYKK